MPYARLLNDLMEKAGITPKELAQQCAQEGEDITASYISLLRRESGGRVPSAKVSAAMERALNAPTDTLVLEGYLEDAPEVMKTALRNMYWSTVKMALSMFGTIGTEEQMEVARLEMEKQPLSAMVLAIARNVDVDQLSTMTYTHTEQVNDTQYNMQLQVNPDFEVKNNAMEPLLPKGSRVKVQMGTQGKSGDVIAYMRRGAPELEYRKLHIGKEGEHFLLPLCPDYEAEEFNTENMLILGRVEAVTRTI